MSGQRDRAVLLGTDGTLWTRLLRQIASSTGRYDEAGDYLNSAWLKFVEYRGADVQNPEAFLVRTAINAARDDVRREHRQAVLLPIEDMENVPDTAPLADEVVDSRRRLDAVQERLWRMNPRTAQIVAMHRVDGLTYRAIAEKLNISESAVEKQMAKATLALMKMKNR